MNLSVFTIKGLDMTVTVLNRKEIKLPNNLKTVIRVVIAEYKTGNIKFLNTYELKKGRESLYYDTEVITEEKAYKLAKELA